jgi:hypothetical protein
MATTINAERAEIAEPIGYSAPFAFSVLIVVSSP